MMGLICELQLPFVCDGSHLQSNLFQHSNYYSHMTQSHMTKPHYHMHMLDVASMATPSLAGILKIRMVTLDRIPCAAGMLIWLRNTSCHVQSLVTATEF